MKQEKIKLLIIGLGNHARRIYAPRFNEYSKKYPLEIVGAVELARSKSVIDNYFEEKGFSFDMFYLKQPFDSSNGMPKDIKEMLDNVVKERGINAVVISTDPLSHKVYALWALSHGLNILMDKPVSTRENVTSDSNEAQGIVEDYEVLLNAYKDLQKEKETIFTVNTQRRYEIGYQKTFQLIKEVSDKFNMPVTSIQAMHSDGVWIFPDEIVSQMCHPYCQGYGKCSHSGYHIFDIVWQFYSAGLIDSKKPDTGEVMSSFIQPAGMLTQMSQEDLGNYFGKEEFKSIQKHKTEDLYETFNNYGENDAFSVVRLLKDDHAICNISLNLLHNSFSRRSWMLPNADLYKGNGRIKHQYYHIQQGPFQCIQIHNYQANDKQDKNTIDEYKLGGNNHFDIYVFRNAEMFGEGTKPLEVFTLKDLDIDNSFDDSRLYHESAKDAVIIEFIEYVLGNIKLDDLNSNITSHEVGVKIMSAVYQSHINYMEKKQPLASFKITK
jgi:hypothetical protein